MTRFMGSIAAVSAALALCVGTSAFAASPEIEGAVVAGPAPTVGLSVLDAKSKTKDKEKVSVQGRVKDFVSGQAVFTMTDASVASCKDLGEACPTPWDYCCTPKDQLTSASATVKLVSAGKTLKGELKGVKGIDHLKIVAAEGLAQRDKRGNLVILADKIYVVK